MAFASCKKDDDKRPADIMPTTANRVGTYTMVKATLMNGSQETRVTSSFYKTYERDDQYKLNANMTVNYVSAGT